MCSVELINGILSTVGITFVRVSEIRISTIGDGVVYDIVIVLDRFQ